MTPSTQKTVPKTFMHNMSKLDKSWVLFKSIIQKNILRKKPLTFNTIRKHSNTLLCSAFCEQSHRVGLKSLKQLQFSSYNL